jgi:hypothetical protein
MPAKPAHKHSCERRRREEYEKLNNLDTHFGE